MKPKLTPLETLELNKKPVTTAQTEALSALRTHWLRNPSINLTDALSSIIKAFQNPIWTERARERLKQIKLLTTISFQS